MGFFGTTVIASGGGITQEQLDGQLILKVDKVDGKGLSTNDYTTAEKNKLNGIANGANNYNHPANHPASIISQDANNRFVSDSKIASWDGKADKTLASTTVAGLVKKCAIQADSTATTIEELLVDFNSLLAKMKNAGLM